MKQITLTLLDDEHEALRRLATNEERDPRAQAALIIRDYLKRKHLLAVKIIPRERVAKSALVRVLSMISATVAFLAALAKILEYFRISPF